MPELAFHTYAKKILRAASRVNTGATDAQREALNYRHGKANIHGLEIMIEYPKGSIRRGTNKEGKKWERVMQSHYGRLRRTVGLDGENVDVFIGEHPESQLVYVIDQLDEDGNLDEHKVVIGTRNVAEARKVFLDNYPKDWKDKYLGQMRGMTMQQFKEWLKSNSPVKNKK